MILPTSKFSVFIVCLSLMLGLSSNRALAEPPNIILVMADDMGWGQTSYNGHPVLKTPNLDAMAASGLRFNHFYAGAPNCSPTRATVMTGRTHDRTNVKNHGFPLRLQEKTIAQALQSSGYATGHFGKWHLSGFVGPGAPVLETDPRSPGKFGFDTWVSVTNFYDRDPLMGRQGQVEQFYGDSSEIAVDEAIQFIRQQVEAKKPFFSVIWYGSPHDPFDATEADRAPFAGLDQASQNHYGELVAMDRSLGTLRKELRDLKVEENTLLWFCSDNGGLKGIQPDTVGGLRNFKGSLYEGGLRVPCVIEWPAKIAANQVTEMTACTMDIFPTVAEILNLPAGVMLQPQDGISLKPLFEGQLSRREQPVGFRHTGRGAMIHDRYKLITLKIGSGEYELYNLTEDPQESQNIVDREPEVAQKMIALFEQWNNSVEQSIQGLDYPEGKVIPADQASRIWTESAEYADFLSDWRKRPEFRTYIERRERQRSRN